MGVGEEMSRLNGNGQVPILGQQQNLQIKHHRFGVATPLVVPLQSTEGTALVSVGGFTLLEEAALRIAAGLAAGNCFDTDIPAQAVSIAKGVLDKCQEEEAKTAGK